MKDNTRIAAVLIAVIITIGINAGIETYYSSQHRAITAQANLEYAKKGCSMEKTAEKNSITCPIVKETK